jgi:hypothetical protein
LNRLQWWMTSFSSVHFVCFEEERNMKLHPLLQCSWSSCLWKLCELVSNIEEQLHIVFMFIIRTRKKWWERKKMHAMRGSKDLYSRILGGSEKGSEGQTQLQYVGICLSYLPLICHYHQIGFALKQVVPFSY